MAPLLPVGVVVLSAPEDTGPDSTGNYVLGRNVIYQFVTGETGTAFFPYSGLTASAVIAAGAAQAAQLAATYATSNPAPASS